jgi:hypothetical protein
MADQMLPDALRQARSRFRYVGNTGITRGAYNGIAQTTGMGGDRVAASIDFTFHGRNSTLGRSQRAQLQAFLMRLHDKQNRVLLGDAAHAGPRGSFAAPELLTNGDFSNGTTGWTASNGFDITAADSVLRPRFDGTFSTPQVRQSVSGLTQYAPYVMRSLLSSGKGLSGATLGPRLSDSTYSADAGSTTRGYLKAMLVPISTTGTAYAVLSTGLAAPLAGDFIFVNFASLSRCFLVDGGGNRLFRSDELQTTWSPSGASVVANNDVAPDGTLAGDDLNEDTSTGNHVISQTQSRTAAVADLCAYGYFRRVTGTRDVTLRVDDGGANGGSALFDLSSGAVSAVTSAGTGSDVRAYAVNAGGNYWFCSVIARCPSSSSIRALAYMTDGGSISYTGTTGIIRCWRLGAYQSGVPTRGAQTTSAAVAAETQQGVGLYVKGLPVSTSGLLLQGDWVEIDGQLKMVTAALDSDAAGLGYLQFSPPLYRSVSDNTPIIVNKPMGRFMLAGDASWLNEPGLLSSASIDLEEAFA